MFTQESILKFWQSRINAGGIYQDPCHYMDYQQDEYIFKVRTRALNQCQDIFQKASRIVDLGCGVGTYTRYLKKLSPLSEIVGIDRSEFIRRASADPRQHNIVWREGLVGDYQTAVEISVAQVVTMLTVYDFMDFASRKALRDHRLAGMQPGSHVMLLDLNRSVVPEYQKNMSHKYVETLDKKCHDFFNAGFDLERNIPVNWIDNQIFYLLGQTSLARNLTLFVEQFAKYVTEPMYTILVFRKL